jgi:hypothetical protein
MAISVATADILMRRVLALVGHDEALSQNSTLTPVFRLNPGPPTLSQMPQ